MEKVMKTMTNLLGKLTAHLRYEMGTFQIQFQNIIIPTIYWVDDMQIGGSY
jgi:hypothetical protein